MQVEDSVSDNLSIVELDAEGLPLVLEHRIHSNDDDNTHTSMHSSYLPDSVAPTYSDRSTFSTNYTESNLPGTGRIIGNIYSALGRQVVHTATEAVRKVKKRRAKKKCPGNPPSSTSETGLQAATATVAPQAEAAVVRASGRSSSSSATFSTNFTMSNLVGPGRVLGNFYSFLGRDLERAMYRTWLVWQGFGFERVRARFYKYVTRTDRVYDHRKIKIWGTKLLRYLHSPVATTKFIALDALSFLVNFSPATRQILYQNLDLVELHSARHQIAAENYHGSQPKSDTESSVHDWLLASFDRTIALIEPDIPALGVTLLSPRNKQLRDQIYVGTDDFSIPLTVEQDKEWREAFKALIENLSNSAHPEITLRYLSYWTLCLSFGRADFDPALTLDLCEALRATLSDDMRFALVYPSELELTVRRIYRYLVAEMGCSAENAQRRGRIPVNMIPLTIDVLNRLARGLMERNLTAAGDQLPLDILTPFTYAH